MSFAFDNHYPHSLPSMTCETTYGSLGERDVQGNAKALALTRLVMTSKYPYLIIFSLWWETRSHDSMLISHLGQRERKSAAHETDPNLHRLRTPWDNRSLLTHCNNLLKRPVRARQQSSQPSTARCRSTADVYIRSMTQLASSVLSIDK